MPQVSELVRRSAELHLSHIATSGDPFEMGSARPLDFGHWAAHKLESITEHRLRHGEAVVDRARRRHALLRRARLLSRRDRRYRAGDARAHRPALWDEGLDVRRADGAPRVLDGLQEFREHLGGELSLTMLRDIGEAMEVHEVDEAILLRCLDALRVRAERVGAA